MKKIDPAKIREFLLKPRSLIGLAILILGFIIFPKLTILALFIFIGAASTFYKAFFNFGLDFELQSFFAISAGVIFGPTEGLIVGFFSVIAGHCLNLMFFSNPILSLTYAISFGVLGMISATLPLGAIVFICMIYVIANDLLFIVLGSMMGANTGRLIVSAIIHAPYTFFLFSRILIPFVKMVGG